MKLSRFENHNSGRHEREREREREREEKHARQVILSKVVPDNLTKLGRVLT